MPLREGARVDHLDDVVRQVEQAHRVRDVRTAAPDPLRENGARHTQVVEQDGECPCLLDGAEVLPHDVLDQRQLERTGLVERVVDEGRDNRLAGQPGGTPSALAGDELVAVLDRPHDHRLKDAALADRVGQGGQR